MLRASLLRYCRNWVLELNEHFIFCPGLRKGPALIHISLKAAASLFWAEPERATPAVPPASHRFVSISGSSRDIISAKLPFLLGIYY